MAKHYLRMLCIVMISTFLVSCGGKKVQKTAPTFQPYKFNANQFVPKVDNFVVILDTSSSMADKYGKKVKAKIANDFVSAMNQTLPELNYNGALRTFGHSAALPDKSTLLVYGPAKYSRAGFGAALKKVKGPSGASSLALAKAINAATSDLKSTRGPIAVIIVSDGEKMDQKPVNAAKNMKTQLGNRVCIDTVLIGDNPGGKMTLEQIAKAGGCGISTTSDRLASSSAMAGFVQGIFLAKPAPKPVAAKPTVIVMADSDGDSVADNLDQCPNTPKGATVDERGCWTYAAVVLFDFDSYKVKPGAYPMLNEAVIILKKNTALKLEIDGFTDSTGPDAYNMKLSEERAKAIKAYLVSQGVDSQRLTTKGFGKTRPAASNDTKEGRAKNRRVELTPVQ